MGVPAGTWLGQLAGWQAPFLVMSGLGLLSLTAVVLCLPSMPVSANPAAQAPHPDRRGFWLLMGAVAAAVTGMFTFHTYVTVFLTTVSGIANTTISAVLLVAGLTGLAGTITAGGLANRWPRASVIVSVSGIGLGLTLAATMGHSPPAAIASVALMGFFLAAVITALQTRILLIAPKNVDVASATGSATFNSGIGAGALLGGFLLERFGAAGPAAVGAALTALALAILLLDLRRSRRPAP
jgi:MFS transporter, DHA1 family, inner membrane transport protein